MDTPNSKSNTNETHPECHDIDQFFSDIEGSLDVFDQRISRLEANFQEESQTVRLILRRIERRLNQ